MPSPSTAFAAGTTGSCQNKTRRPPQLTANGCRDSKGTRQTTCRPARTTGPATNPVQAPSRMAQDPRAGQEARPMAKVLKVRPPNPTGVHPPSQTAKMVPSTVDKHKPSAPLEVIHSIMVQQQGPSTKQSCSSFSHTRCAQSGYRTDGVQVAQRETWTTVIETLSETGHRIVLAVAGLSTPDRPARSRG